MPHEHTTFIIHRAVLFLSAEERPIVMFPYLIHAAKLHVAWVKRAGGWCNVRQPPKNLGVYIPVENAYHSIRGISIVPLNTVHWEKLSHTYVLIARRLGRMHMNFKSFLQEWMEWMECTIQWLQWGSIRS